MLQIRNLSYVTPEGKVILDDINLDVDKKFVAITGPNGSGKSTLARIIAGVITPTSGSITLDGVDITGMSITERARNGVSFAFQQPVRFKGITVSDIISIAAGRELSLDEACEYLSEVGLCARDYIDREINENERMGGSIMIISHQERILSFAEQIILLTAGRIAAIGGKDEIMPLLMNGDIKYECARRA